MKFEPVKMGDPAAFQDLVERCRKTHEESDATRPLTDSVRELLDSALAELRTSLPDLGDRDIARVLMVNAVLATQMIDFGPHWNRLVMVDFQLSVAGMLWDQDKPGAAKLLEQLDANPDQDDTDEPIGEVDA